MVLKDLKHQRIDTTTAQGGRCETALWSSISGNGIFKAEIYIHTNVPTGTGVFTIAAMPEVLHDFVVILGFNSNKKNPIQIRSSM